MPVPLEIRSIERPPNTIVVDTGHETILRYAVRQRKGVARTTHTNPQPVNGKIIGHIVGNQFIPSIAKTGSCINRFLSYGAVAFAYYNTQDILDDLLSVFPVKDAYSIIVIAIIRVIKPGISNKRIHTHYDRTFLNKFYPNCSLSEKTIIKLIKNIGIDIPKQQEFYRLRVKLVEEKHNIVIDGTINNNNSKVNKFSAYTRKSSQTHSKGISILYAYDTDLKEPICASVYPGNYIDASSFHSFVENNNLYQGIIVADKGFPKSSIDDILKEHKSLHYVLPLRNDSTLITEYDMLDFDSVPETIGSYVLYKKKQIEKEKFLYSYKSIETSHKQEYEFIEEAEKNKFFDKELYNTKNKLSGVIVFQSDLNIDADKMYETYKKRWLIELVFKQYKDIQDMDTTRVQVDASVCGNEFLKFISTLIYCKLKNIAINKKLLEYKTFTHLIDDLDYVSRYTEDYTNPISYDKKWGFATKENYSQLEALNLSLPAQK